MPRGVVKFFDPGRGFGFISPDDGREDIFVHISAVDAAGLGVLGEGDELEFDVENQAGRYVATELDLISKAPAPARGRGPSPASARASETIRGVVKWYDHAKGFGFIQPDDGRDDVFIHVSAVERAGLAGLAAGQGVVFRTERDRRSGRISVAQLSLAPALE
jgi:CspA family cold shock protein